MSTSKKSPPPPLNSEQFLSILFLKASRDKPSLLAALRRFQNARCPKKILLGVAKTKRNTVGSGVWDQQVARLFGSLIKDAKEHLVNAQE